MEALDVASSSSTSIFTTGYSSYDVFLNFRGTDTRNNFTVFLNLGLKHRGIDVFIDSEKLWAGEAIGPTLLRAIHGSKISIPVFSEGYANSKWCLLELAQILQCHESNHQLVFPIFFHVDPSHVRNQSGSFEEAFREHEKNFEPYIVESWRKALKVVGNFTGYVIDNNQDQAEIVELVAKRVLDELISSMHLDECKYPIGIDSRVEDLLSLLRIGSNDVQFIGICGRSGIGKTTIVEAVYNRILSTFNKHSFVSDVNKQAMQYMGLASLQKRLLKDIVKIDFDIGHHHKGKKLIKRILCKENVLLVLDDVDSKEQIDALASELNWFGQGSRVIIITRDEDILNAAKIDKEKIYWPQELDNEESLQLFSLHAFSTDGPPQDYVQLSHDVVRYSRGLPFTIEVLGSHLSEISSKEEWKITLRKLKTGKASIFRLASLRRQRKNTYPMKDKPLGWRPLLHGAIRNNNTVALVSRVLGGCLDLNGSIGIDRVGNQFTIAKIRAATKKFDESLKIGQGGFSKVYKGVMNDGTVVAFKRSLPQSMASLEVMETEIEMLSKLKHRHVISMIGFCKEKDEIVLGYEYMANGCLRNHLYGSDLPPLTWKQRLEICIGVARGLHYIHTQAESGIIHRHIKTASILLDEKFVAKIADFGLSVIGHALDHPVNSPNIMGTRGYFPLEALQLNGLTKKYDVYCFGVVLLEVVCARPPWKSMLDIWALRWHRRGLLELIVDRQLEGNYSLKILKKFVKIAKKCLAIKRENRPTIVEVLRDLEYVSQLHEAWLISRTTVADEDSTTFSLDGSDGSSDSSFGSDSSLPEYEDCVE